MWTTRKCSLICLKKRDVLTMYMKKIVLLFLIISAAGLFFGVSEKPEILEYINIYETEPEDLNAHEYLQAEVRGRDIIEELLESMIYSEKDFTEFVSAGEVGGIITGGAVNEINLDLQNRTDTRLIINLPLGLYFKAFDETVQNMVLTESMSVSVEAGGRVSFTARAACMNIYKDFPGDDDTFGIDMIDRLESGGALLELLNILGDNKSEFEVVQAAIWILQDNPPENIIYGALEYDDGERAVSEAQYEQAVRLVELVKR